MSTRETIGMNIVEIRHHGDPIQLQVDSMKDHVLVEVTLSDGSTKTLSEYAEGLQAYIERMNLDGVSARAVTVVPPPIDLNMFFESPFAPGKYPLSMVCDTYGLFFQAKAAGAEGTIFTKNDVAVKLEEAQNPVYDSMTDEQKGEFLDRYWDRFTEQLDDRLSERGWEHIETMTSMELDNALDEFLATQVKPGM